MDWLILILGVPAVLLPLVLLFGFTGCSAASVCTNDSDCPIGTVCADDGSCVSEGEPVEQVDPNDPNPPPPRPSRPANLAAVAIDDHSVLLTWTSNEPGATFLIERGHEDGTDFTPLDIPPARVSPAGTTDDTSGLLEGVTFLYRVSAVVEGQTSQPSDISSATVLPATPTGFTATAAGINQIILSWTNVSTVATDVILERRDPGGGFLPIGPVPPNAIAFSDSSGLLEGTTYDYRLSAVVDGFENSAPQPVQSLPATASATTLAFTAAFTGALTQDQPGFEGFCVVQRLSASLLGGAGTQVRSQVRITLRGSTAGNLTLDNVTISKVGNTGDPYDSASDLTPVATAVPIPQNTPVTLPPVNYAFDPNQDLLVAFDISNAQGNLRSGALTGASFFANPAPAEAGVANRTPRYSDVRPDTLFLIEKIEVL